MALPLTRSARPAPLVPAPGVRHLPALDGLRAIAVVAVIGYHAGIDWLPGGFLGVELFFVVSGFLITSLLLAELDTDGRIDLKGFWVRRARRLLPALALLLAVVAVATRLLAPENLDSTRSGALSAIGYVTNWHLIITDVSYFESIGRPPLLQHLWSLAVEEQYYLIWPLIVAGLVALGGRKAVALTCALGAVASTAWMWVLADPNEPSRVYYGTDTRAAGLLIGGLLASTMVAVERPRPSPRARRAIEVVGVVALLAVIAQFARTSEFDPGLYRGGFLWFGVLTTVVIFAATVRGSRFAKALSMHWLQAIGVRSYGLYLWHWPVFQLTRPQVDVPLDGLPLLVLRVALTVALTEVSFRLVEQPVRNGELRRRLREWLRFSAKRHNLVLGVGTTTLAIGMIVAVSLTGSSGTRQNEAWAHATTVASDTGTDAVATSSTRPPSTIQRPTTTSTTEPTPVADDPEPPPEPEPDDAAPPDQPPPPPGPEAPRSVHALGDSVLLAARDALVHAFGEQIRIDAVVGRQPWDGVPLVEAWATAHPGEHLVVLLGTNGILRPDDVDRIMAAAGPDRRVVFVTVQVPQRWAAESNGSIRGRVPDHPNATIVDWEAMTAAHPEYLGSDRVHPTRAGADALSAAIRQALGI